MIDVFLTLIKKTAFFFFLNSLNVKLHITTLSNEGGMKAPHMRGISLKSAHNLNVHPDFIKGRISHPNFPVESICCTVWTTGQSDGGIWHR